MPEPLAFEAAVARIMELSYPPTTLRLPPARAAGHRLAKPVIAKGNQPVRPVAHTDGLAVVMDDVLSGGPQPSPGTSRQQEGHGISETPALPVIEHFGLTRHIPCAESMGVDLAHSEDGSAAQVDAEETARELATDTLPTDVSGSVKLQLKAAQTGARRDDGIQRGEAVAVPAGGEVPRGADFIYPFEWLLPAPQFDLAPRAHTSRRDPGSNGAPVEDDGDDDALPAQEPQRDWDLPPRYASGDISVPLLATRTARQMTAIGDWARNKEPLFAERTILRAGELALLEALEIDEVEVYRRPVIGIASLAPPFPSPQHPESVEEGQPAGLCPLITLAVELARSARIAALPLGFAPRRFRSLISAVEHWVEQVDVLLLVGGSHYGPRCLALDALQGAGKAVLAGIDLQPGGGLSAGVVHDRPVLALPGSFADVLVGFVLFARQLAHKYLLPTNYTGTVEVVLDCAARIRVDRPVALPIRYGWDHDRGAFCSRFTGRVNDGWMDYVRGQGLAVFEPGLDYRDGDIFTTYAY